MRFAALGVWVLPLLTLAVDPSDWEVTNVPGLSEPVNFKHYSGFLNAADGRQLHYWFMESQQSPAGDPLLLWLTGGPGCSALSAVATESGPFRIGPLGVNVTMNPYSWNKVANIIFLESPAGVGFSYDPTGDYASDDTKATEDNYVALLDFFEKYPQFKKNDFYAIGDSYGGIFVSLLMQRILRNPQGVNLKGYAIGNGAVDFKLHFKATVFYANYHSLLGLDLWDDITSNCCNNSITEETCDISMDPTKPACTVPVLKAFNIVFKSGLNFQNIYDPCDLSEVDSKFWTRLPEVTRQYTTNHILGKTIAQQTTNLEVNDENCASNEDMQLYYNRRDVIEALHVNQSPLEWVPCAKEFNYTNQHWTMREVIQELINSGNMKTLIYNGDIDLVCTSLGGEWFVRSLGVQPTSDYKMWHAGRVIAGFVQTFNKNVTFVTVKGAGHLVPKDKTKESLHMISAFLSDDPLE
ncbi:lysosomal protective protein-like [Dermacentor andersoni]|uniref:lysosomal protective protein-like n=1 Tax=Dermacentor andersoni TaxID=34620 RepID=UPI002155238E|nr:lysosomal protective protein-like [Dermacentor andersoni]